MIHERLKRWQIAIKALCLFVAVGALVLCVAACAGTQVRDKVLEPAAGMAWDGIRDEISRGIADGIEDGDIGSAAADALRGEIALIDLAFDQDNTDSLADAKWLMLRPWAERGIDDKVEDGDIGPGVAQSFKERLVQFTKALEKLKD